MPRHLHLAAFASAGPVSGSHGGWRHPDASGDLLSAGYYQNLGRLLEEGRFDMVFLADILAVPDQLGDSLDSQLRYGALGALRLEPLLVLAIIAGATQHVGLACTVSTTYAEPFAVARALATLDHLSDGRAAWNIVTSFRKPRRVISGAWSNWPARNGMTARTSSWTSPADCGTPGKTGR